MILSLNNVSIFYPLKINTYILTCNIICKNLILGRIDLPSFFSVMENIVYNLYNVFNFSYAGGSSSSEFGDCSIVQCLTSWIPESIPLQ